MIRRPAVALTLSGIALGSVVWVLTYLATGPYVWRATGHDCLVVDLYKGRLVLSYSVVRRLTDAELLERFRPQPTLSEAERSLQETFDVEQPLLSSGSVEQVSRQATTRMRAFWGGYYSEQLAYRTPRGRLYCRYIILPMWAFITALAVCPGIPLIRGALRRRLMRRRRCCTQCGYNLTGNVSGVCPECGTAIRKVSGGT